MQVVPKVWASKYDFDNVNLLRQQDNIKVGTEIEADLIRRYGTGRGVQLYNGAGGGCNGRKRYSSEGVNYIVPQNNS